MAQPTLEYSIPKIILSGTNKLFKGNKIQPFKELKYTYV